MQSESVVKSWRDAIKKCREHLLDLGLEVDGKSVLLAVSGGMDSMCMMYLLKEIFSEVAVAHVNYNLRGEASNLDAQLVRSKCKHLSTTYFYHDVDLPKYLTSSPGNLQAVARKIRYQWFEELRNEYHYDYIATAHHMQDSIETCFVHMIRGTGSRGLSGIPPVRQKIIRPLMCFTRQELAELVKSASIPFREDASNAGRDYLRNRIRHNILPVFINENPQFVRDMIKTQQRIGEEVSLMEEYLDQLRTEVMTYEKGRILLDREKLQATSSPGMVLYYCLKEFGFSLDQCRQIVSYTGQTGARFISGSHVCLLDRSVFLVYPNADPEKLNKTELDHKSEIFLSGGRLIIEPDNDISFSNDPNIEVVDRAKLSEVLHLRKWVNGDFFYPLGVNGKQKLQDFFVNEKVALPDKDNIWLLTSGGEIVWVCGMRLDQRFRVTPDTKRALRLTWEPAKT